MDKHLSKQRDVEIWFYGAADHIHELDTTSPTKKLTKQLIVFYEKVMDWRLPMGTQKPNQEDKDWALQEAKDLLRAIDEAHGIETEKGEWE